MSYLRLRALSPAIFILIIPFAGPALQAQNVFPLPSGNVGIGTTNPQRILHISMAGEPAPMIENTGDGYASFSIKSNGKLWHLSKRNAAEGDILSLFYHNGTSFMYPQYLTVMPNGNFGIGTATPTSKFFLQGGTLTGNTGDRDSWLTVRGTCGTGGNNSILDIYNYRNSPGTNWFTASTRIQQTIDATPMGFLEFNPANLRFGLALGTNNQYRFYINTDGQVGIGTTNINDATYKLFVETGIRTRKVRVDADTWADYVFHKDYRLPSLGEVEKFIRENRHLPGISSAAEVQKEGIDLGSNQAALLKKIEELTLYLIRQHKALTSQDQLLRTQDQRLEEQARDLQSQRERIDRLERLINRVSAERL